MEQTILLTDQTASGKVLSQVAVLFKRASITVEELIVARVTAEVNLYNETMPEYYRGLIQPSGAEILLNGYKLKDRRKVDSEKQAYIALDAFQKNSFFILVNDRQVSGLQDSVLISQQTTISFIKLTPLIGG